MPGKVPGFQSPPAARHGTPESLGERMKRLLTRIPAGFAMIWISYSVHWYYISEFSKFARFSLFSSTTVAAFFTILALILGLVLMWKPIGAVWTRAGYWTLLISAAGIAILLCDYFLRMHRGLFGPLLDWMRIAGYFLSGCPWFHLPERTRPNRVTRGN
jgi:hypothetical protein